MFRYRCKQTTEGAGCAKVGVCGKDEDFHQILEVVTMAKLKPVIDFVISLENTRDAMDKMEAGKQFGKIVSGVSQ